MLLKVRVGLRDEQWRFRDETALEDWLCSLPWRDRGGIRILRLPSLTLLEAIVPQIQSVAVGADYGNGGLHIRVVDSYDGPVTWAQDALVRAILLEPHALPREAALKLFNRELEQHPCIFIVRPEGNQRFASEMQDIAEQLEKRSTRYPLTVLVIDTPEDALTGAEYFDFGVAQPVGNLLGGCSGESDMWSLYLHHKTAWEVGGDPAEAIAIFESGSPLKGDEAELDRHLDAYATRRLTELPEDSRRELDFYLARNSYGSENRRRLQEVQQHLISLGILWIPAGHDVPRLSAWTARALTCSDIGSENQMVFRYAMVPAPLAMDALSLCFLLEANERCLYWPARQRSKASADAERHCQEYLSATAEFSGYTPARMPPLHNNPWCFASFGEYFSRIYDADSQTRTQVLRIRNALSHGHNVTWKMLITLKKAQSRLLDPYRPIPLTLK